MLNLDTLAGICDHTFLTPVEAFKGQGNAIELRRSAFHKFLGECFALDPAPYSICVPAGDVLHVKQILQETEAPMKLCSIAGFPDGCWITTHQKVSEALIAMALGADEIDMVMNWYALKQGNHESVLADIKAVCEVVQGEGGKLKVIIETAALTADEIRVACNLIDQSGADFAKSSTGFGEKGAMPDAIRLMAENFPRGIKMSGGVTEENVEQLLAATGMEAPYSPDRLRIGESKLLKPDPSLSSQEHPE